MNKSNKKYFKISLIFLLIIVFIFLFSYNHKYKAIYYTSFEKSELSVKNKSILVVNSLKDLTHEIRKIDYKVGIILDKSILDIDKNIELSNWIKQQRGYPIISLGYSNPTYVYFKKLPISDNSTAPKLDEITYDNFKKEKGYCFAYISEDNIIDGKGYIENINIDKILSLSNHLIKHGIDGIEKIK